LLTQPKKIALLLPLTGALSGPGKAIQEGFMATYHASPVKEAIQVTSYDTNKTEIKALYQKAVDNGADYIVGPLTKIDVAVIATVDHPVPTLLLNDTNSSSQDNFYLFGLSPANEATQVAIKAKSKGYSRVLIISPKEAWGQEAIEAFMTQWKKQKGHVVDTLLYAHNEELNQKVKDFLHITNSQVRQKQLIQALGNHIQSWVNRRQDFDVIFVLAYPSKARQIMPLLNYYYAGDMPVYATSSVYAGNANALKDKDLDGLIFCDIPWVFSHQMGARNWPEQFNSYNRLYALGKDSYELATQLNQLIVFPADGSMETSGTLYLKPSQQVTRVLEWGQFKHGLVHSLGHA
jgi:outer membrane PBP1 activator LpoA protein